MIASGELNERVKLEYLTQAVDEAGGVVEAWAVFAEPWCKIISAKGEEAFKAAREQAQRTIRVKLRWRNGVTTAMRLQWQGTSYSIFEVDTTKRHEGELWLTAVAQVS